MTWRACKRRTHSLRSSVKGVRPHGVISLRIPIRIRGPGGGWLKYWSLVFLADDGKRLQALDIWILKLCKSGHIDYVIHEMVPIQGKGRGAGWPRGRSRIGPWVDDWKRLQALDVWVTKLCKCLPLYIVISDMVPIRGRVGEGYLKYSSLVFPGRTTGSAGKHWTL